MYRSNAFSPTSFQSIRITELLCWLATISCGPVWLPDCFQPAILWSVADLHDHPNLTIFEDYWALILFYALALISIARVSM